MANRKPKLDHGRRDRFGTPEGAESNLLTYRDDKGNRISAGDWLEKVKAKSKKKKG